MTITLRLIKRRPATAARVLAGLPAGDAAGFLSGIPGRIAADAIGAMNAWSAAQVVGVLDSAAASGILREMDYTRAAQVLRMLAPPARKRLLDNLPRRLSRSFETSLRFPADSVGANMELTLPALTTADTVKDALGLVEQAPRDTAELLFVTDPAHRYVGVIRAVNLLRHPELFTLTDLTDSSCPALLARARLSSVAANAAWDEYCALPVVSRSGELVGAVRRSALARHQTGLDGTGQQPQLVEALLNAMAATSTGLIELLVAGSAAERGRDARGR